MSLLLEVGSSTTEQIDQFKGKRILDVKFVTLDHVHPPINHKKVLTQRWHDRWSGQVP